MNKVLLSILLTFLPILASADPLEIDGIWYNLASQTKEAEVTYNPNGYSGSIEIPASVTYNKEKYSVTSITIPYGVTSISRATFRNCSNLTSVTIPNSVTYIGEQAFFECDGLTSITIPNSVLSIDVEAFAWCDGLTSITLGNSLKTIQTCAFFCCSGLTSIIIPNSVTAICGSAFSVCSSLTSVYIGSDVKTIYDGAFCRCDKLTDVYCWAEKLRSAPMPRSDEGLYTHLPAFTESYLQNMTLHVPAASIESYRSMEPWRQFGNIVALTDEDLKPMGITEVRVPMNDDDTYYDLFGRKVIPTQKGLYIHKGEKLLIK